MTENVTKTPSKLVLTDNEAVKPTRLKKNPTATARQGTKSEAKKTEKPQFRKKNLC